jgi:TonB family protein
MNARLFCLALLISFSPLRVWAQIDRLEDQLNSAYKGKTLIIRDFYSGDTLRYGSDGKLSTSSLQGPWTLGGMEITGIAIAHSGIKIKGNRMGALFENGKLKFLKVGKLQIHVDRAPSDKESEAAIRRIFMDPQQDLRPFLPDYWQSYLSGTDPKLRRAAWDSSIEKSYPPDILPTKVSPGAVSAPRAVHSPDPKYTEQAASLHFEGTSVLGIVVNTKGIAENIAILSPLGMGMDEQAVKAVQQWRFQPAMKNGQPVRVQITIEILFRCCP